MVKERVPPKKYYVFYKGKATIVNSTTSQGAATKAANALNRANKGNVFKLTIKRGRKHVRKPLSKSDFTSGKTYRVNVMKYEPPKIITYKTTSKKTGEPSEKTAKIERYAVAQVIKSGKGKENEDENDDEEEEDEDISDNDEDISDNDEDISDNDK